MTDQSLIISNINAICTVTLNRPQVHNAFDDKFIQELTEVLRQINSDATVQAVLLTASGENFCAGADLQWMQRSIDFSAKKNYRDAMALAKLMFKLNNLTKPTIALVQGAAVGGGVGLIACCDIAIASTTAKFCLSEVKLGLIPAVISPYLIAAIGERAARRYFLTAESFDVSQAAHLGLIHEIIPPENLLQRGHEIAQQLLNNSPAAISAAKKLINRVAASKIDKKLMRETAKAIARIRTSAEAQEGLAAFFEKRKPVWIK